jgi:S-adenosyl-L-methionine hydrolase (adenosine-forming)
MPSPAIVTLTTDFGTGSSYVGELEGSLLCGAPHATIVDLFHGVGPQNVREGAIRLESCFFFPPETIHIAVVDPGVGAGRAVLFARIRDQLFIAPDNGLLSWIVSQEDLQELRRIENRSLFRSNVSRTFEGRDVMAPVAAALIRGVPPEELGPTTTEMVRLEFPRPKLEGDEIIGEILYLDSYGNAVTNVRRSDLPADRRVASGQSKEAFCRAFVETYAQAPAGELVLLFGSGDRLEFAVVNGSAAASHHLRRGDRVRLRLSSS